MGTGEAMRLVFAIGFASIIGLAVAVGASISVSAENFGAGTDASSPTATPAPPGRVGQISLVSGKVDFRGPGERAWSDAEINDPVATGVSLRTDPQARAELRIGADTIDLAGASRDRGRRVCDEQIAEIAVRHGRIDLDIRDSATAKASKSTSRAAGSGCCSRAATISMAGGGDQPARIAAFTGRARFFGGGASHRSTPATGSC